jgi:hypothetical protein
MPDLALDTFPVGTYLTDGTALLGVVGELPQEPSLRLVENCRTLEVMVLTVDTLRERGVRRVA